MVKTDEKAREAADLILQRVGLRPVLGVILGSGIGCLTGEAAVRRSILYDEIPHFPVPTVHGHDGVISVGPLGGADTALMLGRFHYYEGLSMNEVTFPVKVLFALGVRCVIVTNAAGGVGDDALPGDFMAVTDHINLMGVNPLIGAPAGGNGRERFVDMTDAYDAGLIDTATTTAREKGLTLKTGVLAAVSGPCYETPAEVRMLKALGADAVCMSTVPEVIMARYLGMKVLALSIITNKAAGLSAIGPGHKEVLDMARERRDDFAALLEGVAASALKGGLL